MKPTRQDNRLDEVFDALIRDSLRDPSAIRRLPPDFAARVITGAAQGCGGAARWHLPHWAKVAASVAVLASFTGFAAWVGAVRLGLVGTSEEETPPVAVGKDATPGEDIFDITEKGGENMIMARKVASLVGASLLSVATPGEEITSEPTFVFLRPETSSFWNTATNSTMTLPIDYPTGATRATLTVNGDKYAKSYANITNDSFDLELPPPTSFEKENVYDLVLTFDDGTVRTAKLGLVQSFAPDSEGITRCLAPAEGSVWNTRRSGSTPRLHAPSGTYVRTGVRTALPPLFRHTYLFPDQESDTEYIAQSTQRGTTLPRCDRSSGD